MSADKIDQAIARIEAASSRIAAAAAQKSRSTAELANRHEALRQAVRQSLSAIDSLIASAES